jgi:hypothetical protein
MVIDSANFSHHNSVGKTNYDNSFNNGVNAIGGMQSAKGGGQSSKRP